MRGTDKLIIQSKVAFPPAWSSIAQEWKPTAYIKEGACMLQDQLVGIRFVFTVGDIHLKFIGLKRAKTGIVKHLLIAPLCPLHLEAHKVYTIKTGAWIVWQVFCVHPDPRPLTDFRMLFYRCADYAFTLKLLCSRKKLKTNL